MIMDDLFLSVLLFDVYQLGSLRSSFCIYSITYDGNQISMQSGLHQCKSAIFYDMTIYSVSDNVYILTLFRECGSHQPKTLSVFSLQNGEDEELLQHCYTHAVPATSNRIYRGRFNSLDYVVTTRERGFEYSILLNESPASVTIPNSSLLTDCLIRNDCFLFALDSGGLALYTMNSSKQVTFQDKTLRSVVFKQILDLGESLLLIAEGGNSYIMQTRDLYQADKIPVALTQVTKSIAPCSQMCVSYDTDGFILFSILTGRDTNSQMIEGRYGVRILLHKQLWQGQIRRVDIVPWKSEVYICISDNELTNVFQMTNDTLIPVSLSEVLKEPSLVIGMIGNILVQVTSSCVHWTVNEEIHTQSIASITNASLYSSELILLVNTNEVWRWTSSSSYQCQCIFKSDIPILHIELLKEDLLIIATENSIHLIQSESELTSLSLPSSPRSIAHLSTFSSILLLVQLTFSLHYYRVMNQSLVHLHEVTLQSDATLHPLSLNGIHTIILSPFIILPSSPYQLIPFVILSNSFSVPPSLSFITSNSYPLNSNFILLAYDSVSLFLAHCPLQQSPFCLDYDCSVSSVRRIYDFKSDQMLLAMHASSQFIWTRLQDHKLTSQTLSLPPVTAITTLDSRVVIAVTSDQYKLICFSLFPDITTSITCPLPSICSKLQVLPHSHCVAVCAKSLFLYHITQSIQFVTSLLVKSFHLFHF